jgi:PilZ domain
MSDAIKERCAWIGCGDISEAEISKRPLCPHHFYLVAQRRLSALLGLLSDDELDRTLPPEAQGFLAELVSEIALLTSQSQRLSPERMEELLKLSVTAAALHKKVQRPIRLRRRITIMIALDDRHECKPQESTTVNLSNAGACIETSLPLHGGQTIWVQRHSPKAKARARVAWVRSLAPGLYLAGIAFIDATDFWGLQSLNPGSQNPVARSRS